MGKWALWAAVVALAGISAGAAGCLEDNATIEGVCVHVCECTEAFPGQQRRCAAECIAALESFGVPQDCLECVAALQCSDLDDEAVCEVECQTGNPSWDE